MVDSFTKKDNTYFQWYPDGINILDNLIINFFYKMDHLIINQKH
jgi:hypothetical protein